MNGFVLQGDSAASAPATNDNTPDNADVTSSLDTVQQVAGAPVDLTAVDPASLPLEVQATYKDLIRSYHEKTQSLAEKERGLLEAQAKATAFDRLMDVQGKTQPSEAPGSGLPFADALSKLRSSPKEVFADDSTLPAVQAAAFDVIQTYLMPLLRPYEEKIARLESAMNQQQTTSEWSGIIKEHPNATAFEAAAREKQTKTPGLTLKEALYAVAGPQLFKASGQASSSTPAAPKVGLTKTNGVSSTAARPSNRDRLLDLLKEARREQGL